VTTNGCAGLKRCEEAHPLQFNRQSSNRRIGGEALLEELKKAGFVWIEGEYTIVGEGDKSGPP
jgi:hypothetical protein